eukprot:1148569-Pelagomonas_calceolata.AAC.1
MDIMLTGEDQSQADQPNTLAEGPPVHLLLQLSCPRWQLQALPALSKEMLQRNTASSSVNAGH